LNFAARWRSAKFFNVKPASPQGLHHSEATAFQPRRKFLPNCSRLLHHTTDCLREMLIYDFLLVCRASAFQLVRFFARETLSRRVCPPVHGVPIPALSERF